MKRSFQIIKIVLLLFAVLFSQQTIAQLPTDNRLKTPLDSLVQRSVSAFMQNHSRVGISVGIIKNGKKFIYNYGSTVLKQKTL
ncbi:hypothetical protein [Epilithonimonas hungarica]|uniref:Beta-lactamase-related domain-containing protein n=1 Tax=Epilithonimonas hungarica TaxID=454006 RepID=A0A1G7TKP1_9FLAO|nr:hypothetical protein [Epilithonimonas hungarica]SDG35888.1 hypothetical protein SAMN05421825_3146 [Epilithonimonas hungarica]